MTDSEVYITKHGKINFVDLAGSEMTKKTKSTGKTLEEANNINKSLMVLGYCIASLSDPKKKNGHIPYRDSKLTKLLADSLAGNGVTLMFATPLPILDQLIFQIACISPAMSNLCETMNTLRYAARAKKIKTKPIIVMDPRESLIVALKREVEALENENARLRMALDLNKSYVEDLKKSGPYGENLKTPPQINIEKLAQMDSPELVDLIKHYAVENEALRKENSELFHSRDVLMRDHQIVCRENERLLKKLEADKMSPVVLTRTSHSAEAGLNLEDSDIQTNNYSTKNSSGSSRNSSEATFTQTNHTKELPDSIQKEMNKKRIGKAITNIMDSIKTRKSAPTKKSYDESQRNDPYTSSTMDKNLNVLYDVFGTPLLSISRRASIENDLLSTDFSGDHLPYSYQKRQSYNFSHNSPSLANHGRKKQSASDKSSPLNGKKFPNPFGNPVSPII